MNTMNKKAETVSVKPTWEGMAKMLIVLIQSEKVGNVNFAKDEFIKMGVHLDELEQAARKVTGRDES